MSIEILIVNASKILKKSPAIAINLSTISIVMENRSKFIYLEY